MIISCHDMYRVMEAYQLHSICSSFILQTIEYEADDSNRVKMAHKNNFTERDNLI